MSLIPSPIELRARALTDLRMGMPVVLDLPQPLIICASETLTESRLSSLRSLGDVEAVVSKWRANTLKIPVYDTDVARIAVPENVNALWCQAAADPVLDMNYPMKGPFRPIRGGDATGARAAVNLLKAAQLLPMALMVSVAQAPEGLTKIPTKILLDTSLGHIVSAALPLHVSQAGRLHVFRPNDGGDEHYAVEIGAPDLKAPILTRLHSACFTGDILGSLKCDCGLQLNAAMAKMGSEGTGILLYLNQEGRGIGLANKMRAYALQSQGFDTVQANHRLGFDDDERDFRIGAEILKSLGFYKIRLMTNNLKKVDRLRDQGLNVIERVPLIIKENQYNHDYLQAKLEKSGHIL